VTLPRLHARYTPRRAALLVAIVILLAAPAAAAPPPRYYVSLGDSLAVGMQPDARGHDHPTAHGYADLVARRLAARIGGLRLVKLGCAGETSTTLVLTGPCRRSQLAQAEAFLSSHRGSVSLITVNVGDNDIEEGCFHASAIDYACVEAGLAAVRANIPVIIASLRSAAGDRVPIVGISDYDQFLAYWLRGPSGRRVARASVPVIARLNRTVDSLYRQAGVHVADAAPEFASTDLGHPTRLAGHGRVPRGVATLCRLTWACGKRLDDHPNDAGYHVLATVIERVVGRLRLPS